MKKRYRGRKGKKSGSERREIERKYERVKNREREER